MVFWVEADSFGQSKCFQVLLQEPGTIVELLKLAKVWHILNYDTQILSKFSVCIWWLAKTGQFQPLAGACL